MQQWVNYDESVAGLVCPSIYIWNSMSTIFPFCIYIRVFDVNRESIVVTVVDAVVAAAASNIDVLCRITHLKVLE